MRGISSSFLLFFQVDPFGPSALVASAPAIGASSDNFYPASIQNGEAHEQDGQN